MQKYSEKIRIRFESYDPGILDHGTVSLIKDLKGFCKMTGPNLLPTQIDKYVVMRGSEKEVHEVSTHRRTVLVSDPVIRKDKNFINRIGHITIPNGIHVVLSIGD